MMRVAEVDCVKEQVCRNMVSMPDALLPDHQHQVAIEKLNPSHRASRMLFVAAFSLVFVPLQSFDIRTIACLAT